MIRYKLTDKNMCTFNNTNWEIGVEKHTDGKGELCGPGWLHCYNSPILAIILNPIHAKIKDPRLFKCEATGNHKYDRQLKEGSTTMKLLKEIPIPKITIIQKIAFSIMCSLIVYKEKIFVEWANNWLNNIDRSTKTAYATAYATYATAYATYATNAAYATAYAAYATKTAYATAYATYAATNAATNAANINFKHIAKKAMEY